MEALRTAVAAANLKIRDISDKDQASDGMGTTVTAMLLAGDQLALFHVGDSRGYRLHEGTIAQITKDDTYVQTLVDQGLISPGRGPCPSSTVGGDAGGPGPGLRADLRPAPGGRG
jgi:protein phosphatase